MSFYTHSTRNKSLGFLFIFFSEYYFPLFYCFLFAQPFDKRRTTMINLIPFSSFRCSSIWNHNISFSLVSIFVSAKHDAPQNDVHCFYFILFSDSPINNILSASSWTNVFSRHWYLNNCFDSSERLTSFMWIKPPKVFLFLKSSKNGSCLWTKNGDKRPFFFCLFVSLCRLIALSFQWETVVFVCTSNDIVLNGITHIQRNVFTFL